MQNHPIDEVLAKFAKANEVDGYQIRNNLSELSLQCQGEKNVVFLSPKSVPGKPQYKICTYKKKNRETKRKYYKIKILESGMLRAKGQKFLSFDDFRNSPLNPQSPPERIDLVQLQNQFAHAWGLKGKIRIVEGFVADKEGSFWRTSAGTILKVVKEMDLSNDFGFSNDFNTPEIKSALKSALEGIKELGILRRDKHPQAVGRKIIKLINQGKPVVIPSGYSDDDGGHAIYITYYRGYLAFTNRGSRHANNKPGTYYFKVNEEKLKREIKDKKFVRKLIARGTESEFLAFQPFKGNEDSYRGEMVEILGLSFAGFDPKKDQKVGNCTFANCIAAMHAVATLKTLNNRPLFDRVNELKLHYKAFTFEIRKGILETSVEAFGLECPQFNKDLRKAVKKMNRKYESYKRRNTFPGQEKEIKRVCRHYSEAITNLANHLSVNSSSKAV